MIDVNIVVIILQYIYIYQIIVICSGLVQRYMSLISQQSWTNQREITPLLWGCCLWAELPSSSSLKASTGFPVSAPSLKAVWETPRVSALPGDCSFHAEIYLCFCPLQPPMLAPKTSSSRWNSPASSLTNWKSESSSPTSCLPCSTTADGDRSFLSTYSFISLSIQSLLSVQFSRSVVSNSLPTPWIAACQASFSWLKFHRVSIHSFFCSYLPLFYRISLVKKKNSPVKSFSHTTLHSLTK